MSAAEPPIVKLTAMSLGVTVVMTLPAGAQVDGVISNLFFLPGGRTRTLSTTVTQDDIYKGRISRFMPDLDAE
jgi:hypothetical protein